MHSYFGSVEAVLLSLLPLLPLAGLSDGALLPDIALNGFVNVGNLKGPKPG